MNDLERRLRADLHVAVDGLTELGTLDGPSLRTAARERRGVGRLVISLAVAATLIGAVALVSARHFLSGIPTSGPALSSWEPRGDAGLRAALGAQAVATWDASLLPAAELPHHDVRAIYAADTIAGKVVVLEGVDALGTHRLAVFGTEVFSKTAYKDRLHLLSDKPSSRGARIVAWDLPKTTPRPTEDRLLIVLVAPKTTTVQWRGIDTGGWQTLATPGGAGSVVHEQKSLDTQVRVGRHGAGLHIYSLFRYPDHELSAAEKAKNDSSCEHTKATGNRLDVCSLSAGGSLTVGGSNGSSDDLLMDVGLSESQLRLQWREFNHEIEYGAQSRHASSSFFGGGISGSGLLPDDTGLVLEGYTPQDGLERVALYVDRPELAMGAFWLDRAVTGPLPAVLALLPRDGGRWMAGVVAGLATVEVRVGQGAWHPTTRRGQLMYIAVPTDGQITVRVRDRSGAVVREGPVDTEFPIND